MKAILSTKLRRGGGVSACLRVCAFCAIVVVNAARGDAVDDAVANGTRFLMGAQDDRGAIVENGSYENALTALSALSLAALGHLPSDPTPQGQTVSKALSFLLRDSQRTSDGYFGAVDNSRMYGHGIATLFLSEMLGMGVSREQDERIRAACARAVELILEAQAVPKQNARFAGGWRYRPTASDSDLSISIWQVLALRSAKRAGMAVPSGAIDAALGFLRGCFYPSKGPGKVTGFLYMPDKGLPEFSTSCAGMLAFQICGQYEAAETSAVADWMLQHPPRVQDEQWFYYGMYYYAQSMHQRGGAYGEAARQIVPELLIPLQEPDGSWKLTHPYENKRIFRTALALLSLSVKYHYLPIYQR